MAKNDLTAAKLRELLYYDPLTGVFTRLVGSGPAKSGSRLGKNSKQPHIRCAILGRGYLLHRLAWLYMTGEWPKHEIDHINRDSRDNRWTNLRDATHSLNQQNIVRAASSSATGVRGVYPFRNGFNAAIQSQGVRYSLGSYSTLEQAATAYDAAKTLLHKA